MIEILDICKEFGGREVLQNVNAVFHRGKSNLIIGKSGSGKTVLLKLLLGLMPPDQGTIRFEGVDIRSMRASEREQLRQATGMVFQNGALFDSMTVVDNVMFPLRMYGKLNKKQQLIRAQECLERVELGHTEDLLPGELSGGMRKRVAIARAIAPKPRFLLCDEPNTGLDPVTSLIIDALISELTREYDITTIINTHDMNSVLAIGDNVLFLHEGHLGWQGSKEEVLDTQNEELNTFVFATPLAQRMKRG